MDNVNILDRELSEEEATKLAEEIQSWKEDFSAKLEAEAEEKLQAKIDELDEQTKQWKEEVAEAYSEKFLAALDEMREDVRAEVLAEAVETDPAHKVMEEVMRLVAPLMNEDYVENTYMSQIKTLTDKLAAYEKKEALEEGRKALEELIENYDDSFKPALRVLIGEGTVEEVTSKFEAMVESLNDANSVEESEDSDIDEEDFDFDFDEEDEVEEDDEIEEDENADEFSLISEDEDEIKEVPTVNKARASLLNLI